MRADVDVAGTRISLNGSGISIENAQRDRHEDEIGQTQATVNLGENPSVIPS
jgi:hypothetical protein